MEFIPANSSEVQINEHDSTLIVSCIVRREALSEGGEPIGIEEQATYSIQIPLSGLELPDGEAGDVLVIEVTSDGVSTLRIICTGSEQQLASLEWSPEPGTWKLTELPIPDGESKESFAQEITSAELVYEADRLSES